jgi:photosystem II stability/assembly factor-like uncharacterized protein
MEMADERDLDAEIREALEGMAVRPAPDRLLDQVAAIPAAASSGALRALGRPNPSRLRLGFSLASAAIVAIVIGGALYFRGGIQNAASASTPPASASSIAAETASPTPASSTSAIASTPSPSLVAVAPSSSPNASPTAPDAIPPDFQPLSVTFVSADMGWALGSAGCGANTCPVIVRTLDGGRTWSRIAAPPTPVDYAGDYQAGSGVSGLRFADPLDGWAFGPGLWATHDGGKTWKQISIPSLPNGAVAALEASSGAVQVVAYDGSTDFRIASSPVSSDALTLAKLSVPVGAGPVPEVQLVLQGQAGWVLENDRVVTAGARLVNGTWQTWQPPCLDVLGPATLAAANAQELNAVCTEGIWGPAPGGQQGDHLYRSSDGGQTFVETGPQLAVSGPIGAPSASTIVASSGGSQLVMTIDGGLTWNAASLPTQSAGLSVGYLGFTTPTQGVLIASDTNNRSQVLMTRDGGHTWTLVQF